MNGLNINKDLHVVTKIADYLSNRTKYELK